MAIRDLLSFRQAEMFWHTKKSSEIRTETECVKVFLSV